jgi:hypothetical protein
MVAAGRVAGAAAAFEEAFVVANGGVASELDMEILIKSSFSSYPLGQIGASSRLFSQIWLLSFAR